MKLLDVKFKQRLPNYLFQCGLATVSLIIILLIEDAVFEAAIVVAVASTAFIIFVVPDSVAATPRRVVGGHLVAIAVGSLFFGIPEIPPVETLADDFQYFVDLVAALSAGLSILVMVTTDTEHPPAAGTALGLIIPGWTGSAVVFVVSSVLILSLIRIVLRPKLVNLL